MKRKKIIFLDIIIIVLVIILALFTIVAYIYFDKFHPKSCVVHNITLEVKKNTVTKTGATFIITNSNDVRYQYSTCNCSNNTSWDS